MSGLTNVRVALETALSSMTPSLETAWENWPFSPASGVPYQKAHLLRAQPDNAEYGSNYREQGIFQVTLMYPLQTGPALPEARAAMIRETFARGESFSSGGVVVTIDKTPEVTNGRRDEDRWVVPVKIIWHAHVSV